MPCLGCNDQDGEVCGCISACLGRRRRPQRPEALSTRRAPREVANTSMLQLTAIQTARIESGEQTSSRDTAGLQAVRSTTSRGLPRDQAFPSEPAEGQAVLSAAATREGRVTHRSQNDSMREQTAHLEGRQSSASEAETQHIRSGRPQVAGRTDLRTTSPAGPVAEAAIHRVSPASAVAERPSRPSLTMPRTGGREFEVCIDALIMIGLKNIQDLTASIDSFIDELAKNYNRATPVQHPRMRKSFMHESDEPRNEWICRKTVWNQPNPPTLRRAREPLPIY